MQYTECLAIILSLIAVFQSWYSIRKSNRPYISIQLIPYNKRLYLKIKNNGNQDAKINNVSYLGAAEIENINRDHMPLNNCNPFTLYYDEQTNLVRASYKLASAKANISCAEAIYFAYYDILQKSYLDELFFKFDRLLDEIVRDVHTDHSKQYVYDYADDLVEHFNDSDFCCDGYKIEIVYKDE